MSPLCMREKPSVLFSVPGNSVRPIFVSPGTGISLKTSINIVMRCLDGYRIPKPTREADHYVGSIKESALFAKAGREWINVSLLESQVNRIQQFLQFRFKCYVFIHRCCQQWSPLVIKSYELFPFRVVPATSSRNFLSKLTSSEFSHTIAESASGNTLTNTRALIPLLA